MAANKHRDHLIIMPEDGAYASMAKGFLIALGKKGRQVRIDNEAGGWGKLLKLFFEDNVPEIRRLQHRYALLLFDADERKERPDYVRSRIPDDIKNRAFVLCCFHEAEILKRDLKIAHFEEIGRALAESCDREVYGDGGSPWQCPELRHNQDELARLAAAVRPFIFTKEA